MHDVDVVFDTIGGDTQNRSWQVLKRGGIMVSYRLPASAGKEAAAYGVRGGFHAAGSARRSIGGDR